MTKQLNSVAATAESRFRDAFHRLRDGCPRVLEPGSKVTQNNVAREAGCDPSALKKTRFPTLVAQIQDFASKHSSVAGKSLVSEARKTVQACSKCDNLRDQILQLTLQRDAAMTALVLADAHVAELVQRVAQLEGAAAKDLDRPDSCRHS